ncbi:MULTISPECIES: hypothetical protein [Amycolatopsis]|uniref:hypothetical protein n=1 Tax=Amycolatopsis TaxID=1813 RepID=UPI003D75F9EA
MGRRDRYELQIARLDGRALRHDPGPVTEFFDLDDDEEFERACGQHFVPLACAAEQSPVYDRLRDMPFLADYVLEIRHRNRTQPIASSRSTYGWDMSGSRFS